MYNFSDNIGHLESQVQDVLVRAVKLLREILVENAREWISATPTTISLLNEILAMNQHGKITKEIRPKILILLCDIVSNPALSKTYGYIFN